MDEQQENIISKDSSVFLDFVRFLAVQLVLIGHVSWFFDAQFNELFQVTKYPRLLFLANLGVILFFILSGMLISNTVFRKMKSKDYNFKIYFIDRFSRIYSGHAVHLVIILVLSLILIRVNLEHYVRFFGELKSLNIVGFMGNLLMLQQVYPFDLINYYIQLIGFSPISLSIPTFGNAFQLWTLGIEWWLYLFFGWFVLGLKKYSPISPKFFLPLLFFSILPIKFLVFLGNNLIEIWFLGVLATLVLYSGKIVSLPIHFPKKNLYKQAVLILALLAFLRLRHLIKTGTDLYTGDILLPVLITILFIFVILLLNENQQPKIDKSIAIAVKFAAGYSYTLYLVHFSVISLIFAFGLPWSKLILGVIAILSSNFLAIAIAYYTEMRHRAFRLWIKKRLGLINKDMALQEGA